ncbi:MAG TPA: hypothetical protein VJ732_17560 [Bryobacteraceae bacterium]|nr:hypothetical protein [Bryobacteraceae bacterium]
MLWVAVLLAYANSFGAGFTFDNSQVILQDARVHAATAANVSLIFSQDYEYRNSTTGIYRPLTTFTYLLNYAVFGNRDRPAGYHWINFLLHGVNVSLVYALGLLLFARKRTAAVALAGVWGLHPVLTESVTNMVGRADLLAAFGVLAGLLCHVRAANSAGNRRWLWLAGLGTCAAVGMFAKENAVVLPAVLLLWDAAFASGAWRPRIAGYLATVPGFLAYFVLRAAALAKNAAVLVAFTDNPLAGAGFWTSRLTAVKVIGKYLGLLIWPGRLSADYSYNQAPLVSWPFRNWEDWQAAVALVVCVAAAGLALFAWRRQRPIFFCIGFFFVTLAPTANIALVIGAIMAERFLYLPAIGFAGCLVWAIDRIAARLAAPPRTAPAVLAGIALAFGLRAYARNFDWRDGVTLWSATVQAAPHSYKSHINLAPSLAGPKGEGIDQAIAQADAALAILDPVPDGRNVAQPYAVAGFLYRGKGDLLGVQGHEEQSREWYRRALAVLLRGERIDRATFAALRESNPRRALNPSGWYPLYLELGDTWLRLSDPRRAIEAFEYGRTIRPAPEFFEDGAAAWRALRDWRRAAVTLWTGLLVNPEASPLGSALVDLYRQTDPQGCELHQGGGSLAPNLACPAVHDQLCAAGAEAAQLYTRMGQPGAAAAVEERAVRQFACPAAGH